MTDDRVHLVCPTCATINRLPRDRLTAGAAAKCGQCGNRLFDGHPVEADAATFTRHLRKDGIPILLDVWAPWCGPCRAMAPEFERAAGMLEPKVRLMKLNSDSEPELSGRLGIRGIPTLILFAGGHELSRQSGAMRADGIAAWVGNILGRGVAA